MPTAQQITSPRWSGRLSATDLTGLLLVAAMLARVLLSTELDRPAAQAWGTVFVAICVQATPFVVLGVAVSTVIAAAVPASFFARVLPSRAALAVPVAGLAGALLPGCECGSVPIAAGLSRRGVGAGPAVAFLLSAPAINPVVLIATSVAFPGRPLLVLARLLASLTTSVVLGWCWSRSGRPLPLRQAPSHQHGGAGRVVTAAAHDAAQALSLLVVGAASAATLNAVLPPAWLGEVASHRIAAVPALAALAVVLAVCSESDAFIAASLSQFSLTARLAFMVVGPAVDVKLIAMQAGTFGWAFALRFAPLTWLVALATASLSAAALL